VHLTKSGGTDSFHFSKKATRNGPADNILTTYAQARFESLSNIWSAAVAPHLNKDCVEQLISVLILNGEEVGAC
jgi:hypothetical protein